MLRKLGDVDHPKRTAVFADLEFIRAKADGWHAMRSFKNSDLPPEPPEIVSAFAPIPALPPQAGEG